MAECLPDLQEVAGSSPAESTKIKAQLHQQWRAESGEIALYKIYFFWILISPERGMAGSTPAVKNDYDAMPDLENWLPLKYKFQVKDRMWKFQD